MVGKTGRRTRCSRRGIREAPLRPPSEMSRRRTDRRRSRRARPGRRGGEGEHKRTVQLCSFISYREGVFRNFVSYNLQESRILELCQLYLSKSAFVALCYVLLSSDCNAQTKRQESRKVTKKPFTSTGQYGKIKKSPAGALRGRFWDSAARFRGGVLHGFRGGRGCGAAGEACGGGRRARARRSVSWGNLTSGARSRHHKPAPGAG